MSVKIGHASIDENGKIAGGAAGDSTAKEVCTRTWYNKSWNVLLRPKNKTLAEKSATACEKGCGNKKIGYDQNQRNTLNTQAKKVNYDLSKIATACECDCSSFMHVCAIAGGADIPYGSNGVTTRTMVNAFVNSGDYEKIIASKYLTSDKYVKRGDILVKEGSHTVMVLEDGANATTKTSNTLKVAAARAFNKKYAKTYKTTTSLNMRIDAGAIEENKVITVIPKGETVRCYGFYTSYKGVVWLYVKYGDKTGFCSTKYLN